LGEENLKIVVSILSEAKHKRAVARHVPVAGNLTAHWAFGGFILLEEVSVVHCPHRFHFICDLCGRECGVLTVKGNVCYTKLDNSKEVAMFGGEVKEG
jgi:hypothetical protein